MTNKLQEDIVTLQQAIINLQSILIHTNDRLARLEDDFLKHVMNQ